MPTTPERWALIRTDRRPYRYELSFLLERVGEAEWVVAGASGQVSVDDLSVKEVILLSAGPLYPTQDRPYQVRAGISNSRLAELRASTCALADLHGAEPFAGGLAALAGGSWRSATFVERGCSGGHGGRGGGGGHGAGGAVGG